MTPTQREAIELAIADFEHIPAASGHVEFVERRIAALRAALAQPAPVQEQQPAPASKPVLLQCLGCERVGTQEQLSQSVDCDCWKHSQPLQDTTAYLDNLAVDRFAVAMKDKMAKQRARGYGGWHDADACPTKRLQKMLGEHVGKGDPVDVGNIAMMLWTRKEPTAAITQQPSLITKIGGHEIIEAADRADEGQENSEHLLAFGRGVGATVLTKLGMRV